YLVKVSGTITYPTYGYELPVTSNKTIIGVGATGRIKNGGFFLGAGIHNVIIRNLTIGDTAVASDDPDDKDFDYDGIQMDTADHVWIDHNTFTNVNDGYIDSRKDTSYVTVSWNVLADHNKTFGIGWTDNSTGKQVTSGAAFTPSSFYPYTLDPAADVPSLVRTYAGPQADIGR